MLQSAFPVVVFGAVAVSIVMSLIFLFSRGSMFDHIGDGGLTGESDPYGSPPPETYASVASPDGSTVYASASTAGTMSSYSAGASIR